MMPATAVSWNIGICSYRAKHLELICQNWLKESDWCMWLPKTNVLVDRGTNSVLVYVHKLWNSSWVLAEWSWIQTLTPQGVISWGWIVLSSPWLAVPPGCDMSMRRTFKLCVWNVSTLCTFSKDYLLLLWATVAFIFRVDLFAFSLFLFECEQDLDGLWGGVMFVAVT